VNSLDGKASLRKDLRFKLFKGASIQFKDTKNADKMAAKVAEMPKVKSVYPVRRYPVPHHVVHSKGNAVEEVLSKRQEGNDTFTTHLMTQVNKFKDAGITGKGIKIAVIDTGVSQPGMHSSARGRATNGTRPTTFTRLLAAASARAAWFRTAPTWSATLSTARTRPIRTLIRSTTAMATAHT
jgi:subtilisin family serine protease